MSILPLFALKPVVFLTLRSVHRSAILFGRWYCNVLTEAALDRGRAVTCAYLMAMGIDVHGISAKNPRRREPDY